MTRLVFQYAVLRAVPRVERGEFANVGVLLYCQDADVLQARVHVDADRLRALHPDADVASLQELLAGVERVCAGEGPAGGSGLGQRFRWLTSPRSTVLQTGAAHSGFTADPVAELDRLFAALVR